MPCLSRLSESSPGFEASSVCYVASVLSASPGLALIACSATSPVSSLRSSVGGSGLFLCLVKPDYRCHSQPHSRHFCEHQRPGGPARPRHCPWVVPAILWHPRHHNPGDETRAGFSGPPSLWFHNSVVRVQVSCGLVRMRVGFEGEGVR